MITVNDRFDANLSVKTVDVNETISILEKKIDKNSQEVKTFEDKQQHGNFLLNKLEMDVIIMSSGLKTLNNQFDEKMKTIDAYSDVTEKMSVIQRSVQGLETRIDQQEITSLQSKSIAIEIEKLKWKTRWINMYIYANHIFDFIGHRHSLFPLISSSAIYFLFKPRT